MKKRNMNTFTKVILGIFFAMSLIMGAIGIAMNMGYYLINNNIALCLLLGMVAVLLVWVIWAITRRIESRRKKIIVMFLLGFLLALGVMMALEMIEYIGIIGSNKYADVTSETGRELVVMRRYDLNQEKLNQRYPEDGGEANPRSMDDFDYSYSAFPKKLWFFMDLNAQVEGELIIAVDSQAQLMIEWVSEDTARLYIENPEEFDRGEFTVTFP